MNAHTPIPTTLDAILDELAERNMVKSRDDDALAQKIVEHKREMEDILQEQAERNVLRPPRHKSVRYAARAEA